MSCTVAPLLALLYAVHPQASVPKPAPQVSVEQMARGCFHHEEQRRDWVLAGDAFTCDGRKLSRDEVASLRKAIVSARREVPDLLTEVGVTKESFEAHRAAIVATVMPESFKKGGKGGAPGGPSLPLELEPLLAWERVAPMVRSELLGGRWGSTESRRVRVTFQLDGQFDGQEVVAESEGLVPWMLPWTVRVGGETFQSEDLAVPRAVLQLLDPKGPCVDGVDGSSWWPDRFWTNEMFWERVVGRELDTALSEQEYTKLAGWERASEVVAVRDVMTGNVNLQPESMFFQLDAKGPGAIDSARWHDFLVDGKPAQTWDDFLALFEEAGACTAKQRWLMEWRKLDPKREIELEAAGKRGISETMVDALVLPAWKDAGFSGRPEFELLLRVDRKWVGTIYLSSQAAGALVVTANPDRAARAELPGSDAPPAAPAGARPAHHWFDDLAFSFHPRSDPPTYARVDGEGQVEVRTMERAKGR